MTRPSYVVEVKYSPEQYGWDELDHVSRREAYREFDRQIKSGNRARIVEEIVERKVIKTGGPK